MNRLEQLKKTGNKAFVAYIMAGDGGLDRLKNQVQYLQGAGVTAIEIGIPFSDPVADGPTIEAAGNRALKHGVTLQKVLEELKSWTFEVTIPLLVMTYLNPVMRFGVERFATECSKAGISGVIIPDLPYEHKQLVQPYVDKEGIKLIQLVTLTTTDVRLDGILREAQGFVYAVTVKGITGSRDEMSEDVKAFMRKVREKSPVPVYAGFGISKSSHVDMLRDDVDGFIVGSAIVDAFNEDRIQEIEPLIHAVTATHSV
ncbi:MULTISPECIES: tryptophan synthase subunit alpha [Planococcus]|uniref:Tryptophan synthase alpha chain n=2 Tax=Planococcus TaxID=1372 RepID=A0ABN4K1G4_9BACL|nr:MULTISPECIES: tryptophan synthase subunit alpha [Planococcus]ALS79787.1 tryptophan synthase subunit alpha [Planococcus kocurii]AQU78227.1 tryptophan synthase subunit alpha [Planococcus faecalis]KAA0957195.1 tryptophan synthase subunit alpha [Planococcus sp. ANT_H30]MDJ0331135.1 tryptophan synthase subunit alpha [Planococcus sp. S3-L1]OHX53815.1 tryptophan synthase subunit alpha [Planococcus faecalis]